MDWIVGNRILLILRSFVKFCEILMREQEVRKFHSQRLIQNVANDDTSLEVDICCLALVSFCKLIGGPY